jgi:hypothetical protein
VFDPLTFLVSLPVVVGGQVCYAWHRRRRAARALGVNVWRGDPCPIGEIPTETSAPVLVRGRIEADTLVEEPVKGEHLVAYSMRYWDVRDVADIWKTDRVIRTLLDRSAVASFHIVDDSGRLYVQGGEVLVGLRPERHGFPDKTERSSLLAGTKPIICWRKVSYLRPGEQVYAWGVADRTAAVPGYRDPAVPVLRASPPIPVFVSREHPRKAGGWLDADQVRSLSHYQ